MMVLSADGCPPQQETAAKRRQLTRSQRIHPLTLFVGNHRSPNFVPHLLTVP